MSSISLSQFAPKDGGTTGGGGGGGDGVRLGTSATYVAGMKGNAAPGGSVAACVGRGRVEGDGSADGALATGRSDGRDGAREGIA